MKVYRQAGNIKAALFAGGILLIGGLLFYTQATIDSLREESREVVSLYAQLIVKAVTDPKDTELDFIFREVIQKVKFPVIYSDSNGDPVNWRNLPEGDNAPMDKVRRHMKQMDSQNNPIPLIYTLKNDLPGEERQVPLGHLHYGDSRLIQQLHWLPYVEIGAVALFILLGFAGFQVIRNNEKRHIWFGIARETAHQLGTPVSSLMGWLQRLKEHPGESEKIVAEMESDTERLQQISDRFSRMGSKPKLEDVDLQSLIERTAAYFRHRLPKTEKNVALEVRRGEALHVKGSPTLLSWAIENLVKNAIDSIDEDGKVILSAYSDGKEGVITVSDTGKGIPKRDWKDVFRPGYSTKEQGWGLGLTLAKRIIEEFQDGEITLVASKLKKGTTFEVRLPKVVAGK